MQKENKENKWWNKNLSKNNNEFVFLLKRKKVKNLS